MSNLEASNVPIEEKEITLIHVAVVSQNVKILEEVLEIDQVDVNCMNEYEESPLHLSRNEVVTRMLLERGANVNVQNAWGDTPLHIAVRREHVKMVQVLLNYGARVDSMNVDEETPLHLSCNEIISKMLLEKGSDVNTKNEWGHTPLHVAIFKQNVNIVKVLLETPVDVNSKDRIGKTPLHLCCNETISKMLLDKGATVNIADVSGNTPLHAAVLAQNAQMVRILLKYQADVHSVNEYGMTSLHLSRNEDITKILLENGADVNVDDALGNTPLHVAVATERIAILEVLSKYQADLHAVNAAGETPLHLSRNEMISKLLLHRGADVNAKDAWRNTPLHVAVLQQNVDNVRLLLASLADINAVNEREETPLHLSCNGVISEMLLKTCADVNARDEMGMTPLHNAAAVIRNHENVETLLKHEAQVNSVSLSGLSPLHCSICYGNVRTIEILLENGANVNAKQSDGRTAIHLAVEAGDVEILKILLRYAAEIDDKIVSEMVSIREVTSRKFFIALERHIITLKALNPNSKKLNLQWVDFNEESTRNFYETCRTEADELRDGKIGDSRISLRDILTSSVHRVAIYASNKNIVSAMDAGDCKKRVSIYADRIERKFIMGQKREVLLKPSAYVINSLFRHELPDIVIREISAYLSDDDLSVLMKMGSQSP